jgi:hypothetical protein
LQGAPRGDGAGLVGVDENSDGHGGQSKR